MLYRRWKNMVQSKDLYWRRSEFVNATLFQGADLTLCPELLSYQYQED